MTLYLTIQAVLIVIAAYVMVTWLRYQGRQIDWLKRNVDELITFAENAQEPNAHPEPND